MVCTQYATSGFIEGQILDTIIFRAAGVRLVLHFVQLPLTNNFLAWQVIARRERASNRDVGVFGFYWAPTVPSFNDCNTSTGSEAHSWITHRSNDAGWKQHPRAVNDGQS